MEKSKKFKSTTTVSVSIPETDETGEIPQNDVDNESDILHPWDQLPLVVMLNVFDYLESSDLLRLATVCKTWRDMIQNTAHFWRQMHLKLNCNSESSHSEISCSYAEMFGSYLRKLSISCHHEHNTDICKCMDKDLLQLLLNLNQPNLTSLKITDLELQGVRKCHKTICGTLTQMLSSFSSLQCLELSNVKFQYNEAFEILDTVISASGENLQSLVIDGLFRVCLLDYTSNEVDRLTNKILSLSCLTKLGIDYLHLTNAFVIALSRSHAGQLKKLKIVARSFMHYDTDDHFDCMVSTLAWCALKVACPSMKVAFVMDGTTLSRFDSITEIMDPVLPIYKIRLMLGSYENDIATALNDIAASFRRSLLKFEMELSSTNDEIDEAFLDLVLDCKKLTLVTVSVNFSYPGTEMIAHQVTQQRKRYQDLMASLEKAQQHAQANTVNGPGSGTADATAPMNNS
ncbi:F-box only protein 39-like [Physella acuta]|uniref:F-box only protein 39-like n=1 Tax=Physella acuta TaxID=109671 RepID=UPI0027DC121D|nr:F-box only protein 39-like [Physella acuta]